MKIYRDVIQGTSQWTALRCGIPTASQFHRIVTPKGGQSKSAPMYLYELLAERMTGQPTDPYTSHWMDRGSELEAEAVNFYHFTNDCETEKVGFITNDAGTIGASPDRLVGKSGLLEIKVPKPAVHVGYLLQSGTAYEEHRTQTQGQLWIAEREWNDLLSYNPALPPALYRVHRDEGFIKDLSAAVLTFSYELERLSEDFANRGWIKPQQEKKSSLPTLEEMLQTVKEAL